MTISDRWIHGQGVDTETEYLVRTVAPRCIVQIDEDEALLLQIVVINHAGEGFGVAMWLDPEPDEQTHRAILDEAIAANENFTNDAFDHEDEQ